MSDFARHHGHVIDALRAMGVASVQCIATSPPYFGLRDYGLEPVIWAPVRYAAMPGLPEISVPAHADPEAFAHCERWRPRCTCGLGPVPDVVLDLFGGSGTTAAVAIELGRHAVLIDANADFSPLQDQRIAKARLPVTARKTGARKGAPEKQAALFDVVGLPHAAQDAAAPMWEDALC